MGVQLNPFFQNWVCSGAFKQLIPALLVEKGETPLRLRRQKLALHYVAKMYGQMQVRPQQVVICSDSAAALMALQGGRSQARPHL